MVGAVALGFVPWVYAASTYDNDTRKDTSYSMKDEGDTLRSSELQ